MSLGARSRSGGGDGVVSGGGSGREDKLSSSSSPLTAEPCVAAEKTRPTTDAKRGKRAPPSAEELRAAVESLLANYECEIVVEPTPVPPNTPRAHEIHPALR